MGPTVSAGPTTVGAFTYIVGGMIDGVASIGRYCSIASDVRLGDIDHPTDWLSTSPFQYDAARFGWHSSADDYEVFASNAGPTVHRRPLTVIGNDVWIGAGAIVRRGVTVGDGAVIGAGAVVVRDVAPYAIVGGVPARQIRSRFDESLVAELLELQWWRFSPNQLSGITFTDPARACRELRERIEGGLEPYVGEVVVLEGPRSS